MAWNCINCESANDYQSTHCEVCGYERYFSIREVNTLLEQQQETPSDFKKVQANYKRTNTVNKKLRQENKALIQKMDELQEFYDNYANEMQRREEGLVRLRKNNFLLKLWLVIAAIIILFFVLVKVDVQIFF